jgi:plastocyanin
VKAAALPAPVRSSRGRAGALFLGVLLMGACRDVPPEARAPRLELAGDTIELAGGTALIEIRLGGRDPAAIEPQRAEASVGDVIRFVAADGRGYSVRFDAGRMTPAMVQFLDGSNQLASPPLLAPGAAWVVSLENAPPGEYPFLSANHGAAGTLLVH